MDSYPHLSFTKRWEISPRIEYLLGECDAMSAAIASSPLRPKDRKKLMQVSLIKGAQATTAIEGNTLTQEEVEKIYEGGKLSGSKQYQEIEVKNVIDAFNYILHEVVREQRDWRVTPERIKVFHRRITKDLGQHADCIPGKWREDRRQVGPYLTPEHKHVQELVERLCSWLVEEFHYPQTHNFRTAVIQAIVTHVYIAWIHPFGDGNGRTGRLLEFFILLRAGLPSIASHLLSNFYNETRVEYYKFLNNTRKSNDLTDFISYAVQGLRDGLKERLKFIQLGELKIFWKNHIFETFADIKYSKQSVFKRKRGLMLSLPFDQWNSPESILSHDINIYREYGKLSKATLQRDLNELVKMGLLIKNDNNDYHANLAALTSYLSEKRRL